MSQPLQRSRVNTVLVFQGEQAIVTNLLIECIETQSDRIVFGGEISLSDSTLMHLREVLLPLVDSILSSLGVPSCCYRLSISNFSAASVVEQQTVISGHSLDVSLLLGLLSAPLGLRVPAKSLLTGHVDANGAILMVQSLPEKMQSAISSLGISRFYIPRLDSEQSLKALRPKLRESLHCAIAQAKGSIEIQPVAHLCDLIRSVFDEEAVLSGALSTGRFSQASFTAPIAQHLGADLPRRFFDTIRQSWMQLESAQMLWGAWFRAHIGMKLYPSGAGRSFANLIQSLPPQARRFVSAELYHFGDSRLQLIAFAKHSDESDVHILSSLESLLGEAQDVSSASEKSEVSNRSLEKLLSKLSARVIAKQITAPVMEARAQFQLHSTQVADSGEFFDTIRAFYLHVLGKTGGVILDAQNPFLQAEAISLLKRAYPHKNGLKQAMSEAIEPTQGGIFTVLNTMAQTLCTERESSYVTHALDTVIDSLDWEEELRLAESFLSRVKADLPPDLQNLSAEELTSDWQSLIIQYVRSRDQFHETLRNT